eukprot:COSAG06_NODE_38791_length_419_cov_3.290625_1_plen_83_part_01
MLIVERVEMGLLPLGSYVLAPEIERKSLLKQTHPKAFTSQQSDEHRIDSQQSQQRVGVFLQSYKSTMMPSSSQPTMHGRTAGL